MKNHVTVKVTRREPRGVFLEFMANPGAETSFLTSQGGLISIVLCDDGTVNVSIYRADPKVRIVLSNGRRAKP